VCKFAAGRFSSCLWKEVAGNCDRCLKVTVGSRALAPFCEDRTDELLGLQPDADLQGRGGFDDCFDAQSHVSLLSSRPWIISGTCIFPLCRWTAFARSRGGESDKVTEREEECRRKNPQKGPTATNRKRWWSAIYVEGSRQTI
jgi:hypothetical protein